MSGMLIDAVFAAIACFGFSYANHTPKRVLLYSAFLGGLGHSVRFFLMEIHIFEITMATLAASILIGLFGVFLAKRLSTPIEIIAFPALLPMVPGVFAYKSVLSIFAFLRSDDESAKFHYLIEFFNNFFITTSVSISLAVGVSIVLLLFYEKSFTMTRHAKLDKLYKEELSKNSQDQDE